MKLHKKYIHLEKTVRQKVENGAFLLCKTSLKDDVNEIKDQLIKELIFELNPELTTYSHHKNGQPYFPENDKKFISISHDETCFAVYICNKPIGIDIQSPNSKIDRAVDYFVNEEERRKIPLNNDNLHLIWCGKEALYKQLSGQIFDFKTEISVHEILENTILLRFKKKLFRLNYLIWEENYVVFT